VKPFLVNDLGTVLLASGYGLGKPSANRESVLLSGASKDRDPGCSLPFSNEIYPDVRRYVVEVTGA
jgi:hypothetical protein